ncbi:DUF2179 domain-containing protein [candidate division KSB1 bacterium]|nr:DUF2179 domain-containing protein [candidate division KSB1 bacterium]
MWIEHKLAIGMQIVRIITFRNAKQLIEKFRAVGYGVTTVKGDGYNGKVYIIFTVIRRRDLAQIILMIKKFNNKIFFSVEDVRMTTGGIFPNNGLKSLKKFHRFLKFDKNK